MKKKCPEIEYGIYNQSLVFSVHVTSIERYQNTPCFSSINIFQGNPNINYIKYLVLILAHHYRKRKKLLQDWSNFFQASYIHSKRQSSLFQWSTVSVNHLENTLNHYFWRPFYDILDCLHASEKVWLFKNTVKTTLILTTVPMLNLVKNYFLGLCFLYIYILKDVVKHVINANWRGYKLCALSPIHVLKQSRSLFLKLPLRWFITFMN